MAGPARKLRAKNMLRGNSGFKHVANVVEGAELIDESRGNLRGWGRSNGVEATAWLRANGGSRHAALYTAYIPPIIPNDLVSVWLSTKIGGCKSKHKELRGLLELGGSPPNGGIATVTKMEETWHSPKIMSSAMRNWAPRRINAQRSNPMTIVIVVERPTRAQR